MAMYTSDLLDQAHHLNDVINSYGEDVPVEVGEALMGALDTLLELLGEYHVDLSEFYDD